MAKQTPEEKRKYAREYQRRRYNNDPEYREKQRKAAGERFKRNQADPEWVKRKALQDFNRKEGYMLKFRGLLDAFYSTGCRSCPETDCDCLDAHHIDPATKDFAISSIRVLNPKQEILIKELEKCICLCRNCHAKLHARKRRREKKQNAGKEL